MDLKNEKGNLKLTIKKMQMKANAKYFWQMRFAFFGHLQIFAFLHFKLLR
jgi:hypothetical protein